MNEPNEQAPSPEQPRQDIGGQTSKPEQAKKPIRALALVLAVVIFAVVVVGVGWWLTTSASWFPLAEADRLWEEGRKAEAVDVYKEYAEKDLSALGSDDRVKLFQRLVEYDLERDDTASAKAHLDKAAKAQVALPTDVVQRVREREEQLARAEEQKGTTRPLDKDTEGNPKANTIERQEAPPVGNWEEIREVKVGNETEYRNRLREFRSDGVLVLHLVKTEAVFRGTWKREGEKISFTLPSPDGNGSESKWFTIIEATNSTMTVLMEGERRYTWNKVNGGAQAELIARREAEKSTEGKPKETTIDLLKLANPEKHSCKGKWELQGEALVSVASEQSIIEIPYTVPEEYTLKLQVERKAGNDALGIGLVVGGRRCLVVLDAAPKEGHLCGLEMIDRKHCAINETTRKGPAFTNGKPSEVVCTVRREGVVVKVDGDTVIDYKGSSERLSLSDYWKTPTDRALFVGSQNAAYRITRMELVKDGGKEGGAAGNEQMKKLPHLAAKLAGTKWINTNKVTFEWDLTGQFLHDGSERKYQVVDDKRLTIAFSEHHVDTLVFDSQLTTFEQFSTKEPNRRPLFTGMLIARQEVSKIAQAAVESKNEDAAQARAEAHWRESLAGVSPLKDAGRVNRVFFAADEATLTSVGKKGVLIWKVEHGKLIRTITGSDVCQGNCFHVTPDGKRSVISTSKETTTWDLDQGKVVRTSKKVSPHGIGIFSPDGRFVALYTEKFDLSLIDLEADKIVCEIPKPKLDDCGFQFTPDGRRLVQYGGDYDPEWLRTRTMPRSGRGEIKEIDVDSGKEIRSYLGQDGPINRIAYSQDGTLMASVGWATVRLWDASSGKQLQSFSRVGPSWLRSNGCAFSPDNKFLACAEGNLLVVWNTATGQKVFDTDKGGGDVSFSRDGKLAWTHDGLQVYDIPSGKKVFGIKTDVPFWHLGFSPSGKRVVLGTDDGLVVVPVPSVALHTAPTLVVGKDLKLTEARPVKQGATEITTDQVPYALTKLTKQNDTPTPIAISPDGKMVASSSGGLGEDNRIYVSELPSAKNRYILEGHSKRINAIAFSSNSQTLFSGSEDGTVRQWDLKTGQSKRMLMEAVIVDGIGFDGDRIKVVGNKVGVMSMSPDGKVLAVGISRFDGEKRNSVVRILDVASGKELLAFEPRTELWGDLVYSPNGNLLVCTGLITPAGNNITIIRQQIALWDAGSKP